MHEIFVSASQPMDPCPISYDSNGDIFDSDESVTPFVALLLHGPMMMSATALRDKSVSIISAVLAIHTHLKSKTKTHSHSLPSGISS